MTKTQYNKIAMFKVVLSVFKVFANDVNKNAALKELVESLESNIKILEELSSSCTTVKKGAKAEKNNIKDELVLETDTLCGVLFNYGKKTGDMQITAITDISESELKGMREPDLQEKARNVCKMLLSLQPNLIAYDVSAESVGAYEALINRFDVSIDKGNSKGTAAVVARGNLKKTFAATSVLLNENLDKLMKTIRKLNPEFYNQYIQSRIIKDLGTRHLPPEPPSVTTPATAAIPAS